MDDTQTRITQQMILEQQDMADLTPGQRLILQLYRTGLTKTEIARQIGVSLAHVSQTIKRLDKRGYSLTSQDLVRKAVVAIDHHLKGEQLGEVVPTASSQMQAASMVLDRDQPKVTVALSGNLSLNSALEAAKLRDQQVEEADYTDITPLDDNAETEAEDE